MELFGCLPVCRQGKDEWKVASLESQNRKAGWVYSLLATAFKNFSRPLRDAAHKLHNGGIEIGARGRAIVGCRAAMAHPLGHPRQRAVVAGAVLDQPAIARLRIQPGRNPSGFRVISEADRNRIAVLSGMRIEVSAHRRAGLGRRQNLLFEDFARSLDAGSVDLGAQVFGNRSAYADFVDSVIDDDF